MTKKSYLSSPHSHANKLVLQILTEYHVNQTFFTIASSMVHVTIVMQDNVIWEKMDYVWWAMGHWTLYVTYYY